MSVRESRLAAASVRAPRCAGVYSLLGDDRELLHVGKAGDLRARLRQHALAKPGPRERRKALLYERVVDAYWEELPDETTAAAREADLIVSLRPPFNASHVVEGRWNFILVTEAHRGALRFELAESAQARGAYGCFPHLGRGVSSQPAIACSDGYTALLRLLWAASYDPASSYPSRITRSAPDRFQVRVDANLRTKRSRHGQGRHDSDVPRRGPRLLRDASGTSLIVVRILHLPPVP